MVRIAALACALHDITLKRSSDAAGPNGVLSRAEQAALDPFTQQAADALRTEAKRARVTPTTLASRTTREAEAVWAAHNQAAGPGRSRLSKAELQAIARANPALGVLTQLAVRRLAAGSDLGKAEAVRAFFATYNFVPDEATGQDPLHGGLPGAVEIDARPIFPQHRALLPKGVLASYDFYERAMDADFATVSLQHATIGGHALYIVYMTTDGDDAYLEVLDEEGSPVASARLEADILIGWDEVFGRTRFNPRVAMLDEPIQAEGMSEPEEQAALGQVPNDWPGDFAITTGSLSYEPNTYRLTTVNVPAFSNSPQKELGYAALEYLWDVSLRHRLAGSQDPFEFGPSSEGTLTLGRFTKPDGKTYEVADWNDIDDGSYTLYFDRTEEGRLKLAIVQFNN